MAAGSFETSVADLRVLLRRAAERAAQPSAAILDSRTMQSTRESGARAGYVGTHGAKAARCTAAADTLGHLLALVVTPANAQDRAHVAELAPALQEATGEHVEWAYRDPGSTDERLAATLASVHVLASVCLMLHRFTQVTLSP